MVLKQTLKGHLIVSFFTWSFFLLIFVFWIYSDYDNTVLWICGLFHVFFTVPALLLHISYFKKNRGTVIKIYENDFVVIKKKEIKTYNKSELKCITLYQSASLDNWGIPFSAMEYYKYLRLTTLKGENIFITNLLTSNLKMVISQFPGVPLFREKGLAILRDK